MFKSFVVLPFKTDPLVCGKTPTKLSHAFLWFTMTFTAKHTIILLTKARGFVCKIQCTINLPAHKPQLLYKTNLVLVASSSKPMYITA